MLTFYLSRYIGTGTRTNPFRPALTGAGWAAIDLRPSPSVVTGSCLVALPDAAGGALPAGALNLGAGGNLPVALRTQLGNQLGVNLLSSSVASIAAELLMDLAGGSRWKPLVPYRVGSMYRAEIHLGGLLWSRDIPVIAGGASVSDDFTRADSTSLGAQWNEDLKDWSIVSNAVTNNDTGGTDAELRYVGLSMETNDQFCEASGTTSGGWAFGAMVRHPSSTTRTYYVAEAEATNTRKLYKRVAGTYTALATNVTGAITFPGTIRVEAQGSTIRGLWNGVQYSSATDTAITSGPHVGLFTNNDSTIYDFSAGDIGLLGRFFGLF